jgi:hypothetical protein
MLLYYTAIRCLYVFFATRFSLAAQDSAVSLTKYDHFVKVPYYNIHTGGRLTERQIGYIASVPYSSMLSISEFASNDTVFNGVNGSFPSSAYELDIANSYGLNGMYVQSSFTLSFLTAFVDIVDSLPKPLYVHCYVRPIFIVTYFFRLQR